MGALCKYTNMTKNSPKCLSKIILDWKILADRIDQL